jgi:hypothetical protein
LEEFSSSWRIRRPRGSLDSASPPPLGCFREALSIAEGSRCSVVIVVVVASVFWFIIIILFFGIDEIIIIIVSVVIVSGSLVSVR